MGLASSAVLDIAFLLTIAILGGGPGPQWREAHEPPPFVFRRTACRMTGLHCPAIHVGHHAVIPVPSDAEPVEQSRMVEAISAWARVESPTDARRA